ncbi:MAG: SDR family NAD(P)-dependent oxidoreductase, partial [Calditrichaeota bacterium]|nr:SDR family NAD(P)-dependent oxidoreductase [Calditrichota bacterium]
MIMENFRNKNILVVGGSSGIGLALVKQLLAREANVFTVSRREAPEDLPPAAKHLSLDITS